MSRIQVLRPNLRSLKKLVLSNITINHGHYLGKRLLKAQADKVLSKSGFIR